MWAKWPEKQSKQHNLSHILGLAWDELSLEQEVEQSALVFPQRSTAGKTTSWRRYGCKQKHQNGEMVVELGGRGRGIAFKGRRKGAK